jgi:cell division inhibitor SepF
MSNPLKKTMVYLGLADEEEVYEEPAPVRSRKSELLTVHPKQYRDAQIIAENFRDGVPVIINLSQMSDADARRLIDFASGLSLGLYGRIERVTSKVFLLSPENVAVSGDGAVAQADPEAAPFTQP